MSDPSHNRTVQIRSGSTHEVREAQEIGQRQALPWGMPGRFDPVPVYRGEYRGDRTVLTVETDVEAVASWLAETANRSKNTAERYRREAERLLLWASSRGKSLSDLGREDFLLYTEFLKAPSPSDKWVMKKRYSRESEYWRPFMGPLSDASRHQCQVVIYSMMRHLAETGWLYANPMPKPRKEGTVLASKQAGRSVDDVNALSASQKALVRHAARSVEDPLDRARVIWIVELLLTAGLRTTEVVEGTSHWLRSLTVDGDLHWVIDVVGKGRKARTVPLTEATVEALVAFRKALGITTPLGDNNEPHYPLFPATRGFRPGHTGKWTFVTRNGLYKRIQSLLEDAAKLADEQAQRSPELARQYSADAAVLRKTTTHDLRHTALKDLADRTGGDMRFVQAFAGHTSIETSSIYTRSRIVDLITAMNKH